MADDGDDEYIRYRGSKEGPQYIDQHGRRKLFADGAFNISGVPDTFDWRDYGELQEYAGSFQGDLVEV